jgi:hypothetical protein
VTQVEGKVKVGKMASAALHKQQQTGRDEQHDDHPLENALIDAPE